MKWRPWQWALLILFVFLPSAGRGCLWIDGTTLEGALNSYHPFWGVPESPLALNVVPEPKASTRSVSGYLQAISQLEPVQAISFRKAPSSFPSDWPKELDQAIQPVFRLDHAKAKAQLESLLLSYPDNYYILANLGVVTELLGDDAGALSFIEKARRQKPDAHGGTEWMHEAVLKAKLALAVDSGWLNTHTITGLPPGSFSRGFTVKDGTRDLTLWQIREALVAHAVPRLLFIKTGDPIVAAMLTELARIEARLTAVEEGFPLLDMAEAYGSTTASGLKQEWNSIKPASLKLWYLKLNRDPILRIFVAVGFGLLVFIIVMLKRFLAFLWKRRPKRSKKPPRPNPPPRRPFCGDPEPD